MDRWSVSEVVRRLFEVQDVRERLAVCRIPQSAKAGSGLVS
jgi:hypothetical protein